MRNSQFKINQIDELKRQFGKFRETGVPFFLIKVSVSEGSLSTAPLKDLFTFWENDESKVPQQQQQQQIDR